MNRPTHKLKDYDRAYSFNLLIETVNMAGSSVNNRCQEHSEWQDDSSLASRLSRLAQSSLNNRSVGLSQTYITSLRSTLSISRWGYPLGKAEGVVANKMNGSNHKPHYFLSDSLNFTKETIGNSRREA